MSSMWELTARGSGRSDAGDRGLSVGQQGPLRKHGSHSWGPSHTTQPSLPDMETTRAGLSLGPVAGTGLARARSSPGPAGSAGLVLGTLRTPAAAWEGSALNMRVLGALYHPASSPIPCALCPLCSGHSLHFPIGPPCSVPSVWCPFCPISLPCPLCPLCPLWHQALNRGWGRKSWELSDDVCAPGWH